MKRQRVINDKFKIQFWVNSVDEIFKAATYFNQKLMCGQELYIMVGEFIEEIIGKHSEPRLYEYCWTAVNWIDIDIREGFISGEPVLILNFINEPVSHEQLDFY